jgi:hypothetical protein
MTLVAVHDYSCQPHCTYVINCVSTHSEEHLVLDFWVCCNKTGIDVSLNL